MKYLSNELIELSVSNTSSYNKIPKVLSFSFSNKFIGKLFINPPSTYNKPLSFTGLNKKGTLIVFLIDSETGSSGVSSKL